MGLWKADGTAQERLTGQASRTNRCSAPKSQPLAVEKGHTEFKLQLFELSFKALRWLQK